jgi:hypothetical protein
MLRLVLVASCIPILLVGSAAFSGTWTILEDGLGDAPTIQAGIDASSEGDTVLVGPGRFIENIDFKGKGILVRGSGPHQTTLDGSEGGSTCVLFESGEGKDTVLEGFTITGGTGWFGVGGGILINRSEPIIRGNAIRENSAPSGNGGGAYLTGDDAVFRPRLENNLLEGNESKANGGGIGVFGTMAPEILNNDIVGNETLEGDGGGIWLFHRVDGAVVIGNRIIDNVAADHGGGILLSAQPPRMTLTIEVSGNLLARNTSRWNSNLFIPSGGGMYIYGSQGWIHHNTFAYNSGDGGSGDLGGGITFKQGSLVVFEQNIIAFSQSGGGIWCDGESMPTTRNNLAWMNTGGEGTGGCPDWWQSNGNLVADPYFCSSGDYTLAEDSPAIMHPAGPLGAFPTPGCGPVPTVPTTWGRLKTLYTP